MTLLNDDEYRNVIEGHQDNLAISLDTALNLPWLLSHVRCDALIREIQAVGSHWECFPANRELADHLPNLPGVYLFVWRPKIEFDFGAHAKRERLMYPLYVGKAGIQGGTFDTIRNRFRQDYQRFMQKSPAVLWDTTNPPRSREDRLRCFLSLRPLEYWYLPVEDRSLVERVESIERRLLALLSPPINNHHSTGLRPGTTRPVR